MIVTMESITNLLELVIICGTFLSMGWRAWSFAKTPHNNHEDRITSLEQWRITVDEELVKAETRHRAQTEANHITQQALLALVDKEVHDCGANPPERLIKARDALLEYLTHSR